MSKGNEKKAKKKTKKKQANKDRYRPRSRRKKRMFEEKMNEEEQNSFFRRQKLKIDAAARENQTKSGRTEGGKKCKLKWQAVATKN